MQKPANLLWTSGWDSTFRLLDLLLVQKRMVQPYYIKDHNRKSLLMELETMEKLKKMIFTKAPYTTQLLLPTQFKALQEITPCERLQQQYKRLAAMQHLGAQYEWLACFAEEEKLYDLELSLETRSPGFFTNFVKPEMRQFMEEEAQNFKIADLPTNKEITFFQYFRFPIHQLTKLDLQQLAIEHGFIDILNQTWFCHAPISGQPCGLCKPCVIAMQEGLRRRIPLMSQLRHFIHYRIKPSFKQILKPARKHVEIPVS